MTYVVVLDEYRRRGIGKKLIEYAAKIAAKNKCTELILFSGIERKIAHKFYRNLGFIDHGVKTFRKHF